MWQVKNLIERLKEAQECFEVKVNEGTIGIPNAPGHVHRLEVRVQSVDDGLEGEEELGDIALHVLALLSDRLDQPRQDVGKHSRRDGDSQSPKMI